MSSLINSDDQVPAHTAEALERYLFDGLEPGGFLSAVLANDLHRASQNADQVNMDYIGYIARWLVHYAPANSYGSYATILQWCSEANKQQRDNFRAHCAVHVLTGQNE